MLPKEFTGQGVELNGDREEELLAGDRAGGMEDLLETDALLGCLQMKKHKTGLGLVKGKMGLELLEVFPGSSFRGFWDLRA